MQRIKVFNEIYQTRFILPKRIIFTITLFFSLKLACNFVGTDFMGRREYKFFKAFFWEFRHLLVSVGVGFVSIQLIWCFPRPKDVPLFGFSCYKQDVLDPLEDCFRIRMVITLLQTCGHYFDRGSSKRRLDEFLLHFQSYILCKGAIPLDIEFDLQVSR